MTRGTQSGTYEDITKVHKQKLVNLQVDFDTFKEEVETGMNQLVKDRDYAQN